MTHQFFNSIRRKASGTSHASLNPGLVVASVCGRAEMDGVELHDVPLRLDYPLLNWIAAACDLPAARLLPRSVFVSVMKQMVEDPSQARETFRGIIGDRVVEAFPDWQGDDLYTEILILSEPLERIGADLQPSIAVDLKFKADGTLGSAKVYSTAEPVDLGHCHRHETLEATLPFDLIIDVLRIVAHQLDQKERSSRLPGLTL